MSSSVDGRFFIRANLEGRASYSSGIWAKGCASVAPLRRTSTPAQLDAETKTSLVGYVHLQQLQHRRQERSENIGLFVNYAFRRVFTFYASYNQQELKRTPTPATARRSRLHGHRLLTFSC